MKKLIIALLVFSGVVNATGLSWLQSALFDKKVNSYSYELETYGKNGRLYVFVTSFGDICYYTVTSKAGGLSCRRATEKDIMMFKKLVN